MNMHAPLMNSAIRLQPDRSGWLRTGQVHWCHFSLSWEWDFGGDEGEHEIILNVSASSEGKTVHSIKFAGDFLDDATEAAIVAVLEHDAKFCRDFDDRYAEERDEQAAWGW